MFHNMIKDVDYLTPSDTQDIGRNQKGDQKRYDHYKHQLTVLDKYQEFQLSSPQNVPDLNIISGNSFV